jgi:hypothetical protein
MKPYQLISRMELQHDALVERLLLRHRHRRPVRATGVEQSRCQEQQRDPAAWAAMHS